RRVVRMDRGVLVTETHHGWVCANAGVDQSNVDADTVALLPEDPDGAARALRERFSAAAGGDVAVVIADTFGRPWREGLTNIAILGGTGKEGSGLAMRWALAGHSIIIGSRDATRAHDKAVEMRERTKKLAIVGHENAEAAALGEVVVVALPATGLSATLPPAR